VAEQERRNRQYHQHPEANRQGKERFEVHREPIRSNRATGCASCG
jgi:hypothetical protein